MTPQRAPHRRGHCGRLGTRLLVLAGALAGLFAMHGLAAHGASSHDTMPPLAVSATVVSMSDTDHASDATQAAMDGMGTTGGEPAEPSPGMAMAGLCLAVLAGAIMGLLLLRRHRIAAFIQPPSLAFVAALAPGRRDRDPPCLFELSVLRT
jgi:hypothetical protein